MKIAEHEYMKTWRTHPVIYEVNGPVGNVWLHLLADLSCQEGMVRSLYVDLAPWQCHFQVRAL